MIIIKYEKEVKLLLTDFAMMSSWWFKSITFKAIFYLLNIFDIIAKMNK